MDAIDPVNALAEACERAGMGVRVLAKTSELRVCKAPGFWRGAETIFLGYDEVARCHMWYWSSGYAAGPARNPEAIASALKALFDSTRDAS